MKAAVDTNVLLDLLASNEPASVAATSALAEAARAGALTISPIVNAELAVAFEEPENLTAFLADAQLQVEAFSPQALLLAASAQNAVRASAGGSTSSPTS